MNLYILVNGKSTTTIVDTGATHNFILVEEMSKLSLTIEKRELCMKEVNSDAKSIYRLARDVIVKIESWLENVIFFMVLMDDFKIILGIEFLYKKKIVSVLHLKTIGILNKNEP